MWAGACRSQRAHGCEAQGGTFGGPRRVARSDVVCDWSFEQAAGMIEAGTNRDDAQGAAGRDRTAGLRAAPVQARAAVASAAVWHPAGGHPRWQPGGRPAAAAHAECWRARWASRQHGGPCLRTTDLRRLCAGARGARHLRRRRVSGPSWRPENSRWIATRRCRAGASARCAGAGRALAMGRFRARRARAEDVPDPDLEPAAGARVAPRRAGAAELRDGTRRCRTARGHRGLSARHARHRLYAGAGGDHQRHAAVLAPGGAAAGGSGRPGVAGGPGLLGRAQRLSCHRPGERGGGGRRRAWRQARNGPSRRGWCSCRRRTNIPPART